MKYQVKQLSIITTILMLAATNVYAGCEWTHGSLGVTVQSTSDRLKQYSECKQDCQQLEAGLSRSITLMNTASECDADVLTAKNSQMVEFFNRRFQLIRKVKNNSTLLTGPVTTKPQVVEIRETKMDISSQAYQALWLDDVPSQTVQRQANESQIQAQKASEIQIGHQRRVEQQRQIQLQNQRNIEARKRKILLVQHRERIRLKQLQYERARAQHLAKQKARLQRIARMQN